MHCPVKLSRFQTWPLGKIRRICGVPCMSGSSFIERQIQINLMLLLFADIKKRTSLPDCCLCNLLPWCLYCLCDQKDSSAFLSLPSCKHWHLLWHECVGPPGSDSLALCSMCYTIKSLQRVSDFVKLTECYIIYVSDFLASSFCSVQFNAAAQKSAKLYNIKKFILDKHAIYIENVVCM